MYLKCGWCGAKFTRGHEACMLVFAPSRGPEGELSVDQLHELYGAFGNDVTDAGRAGGLLD